MTSSPNHLQLSQLQKYALVFFALILAIFLFVSRGVLVNQKSLDYLARRSLDPQIALSNGKATLFEFYADWCEVCKEMAPAMVSLHDKYNNKVNFVMLNIENNQWDDLIDKYEVSGIPQINFFNQDGQFKGKSIGAKTEIEIMNSLELLLQNAEINGSTVTIENGKTSSLNIHSKDIAINKSSIKPMTHSQ